MTDVVNKRVDDFDVSISRDSKYGNPFRVGPDGSRKDVIKKHRRWLMRWILHKEEVTIGRWNNKWVVEHLKDLDDQILGCFCKPLACHGDTLVEFIGRFKMRDWPKHYVRSRTRKSVE